MPEKYFYQFFVIDKKKCECFSPLWFVYLEMAFWEKVEVFSFESMGKREGEYKRERERECVCVCGGFICSCGRLQQTNVTMMTAKYSETEEGDKKTSG